MVTPLTKQVQELHTKAMAAPNDSDAYDALRRRLMTVGELLASNGRNTSAHTTTGEQLPSDAIAVFVRRDLHREPRNPNLNGATPFGRRERVAPCWSASA